MRVLIALLLSVFGFSGIAQDYEASLIPQQLLKDANAVVRLSETTLDIKNPEEATYRVKTAVTVLNEKGDQWGGFADVYNKLQEITSIKITLYNGFGKQVKKVKKGEIVDRSMPSAGTLYDDNRMKIYVAVGMEYPYTIVTEVEKSLKSSLQFPEWNVRSEEHLAVERASLKVLVKAGYQLRYKLLDYQDAPIRSRTKDEKDSYKWVITGLVAAGKEFRGPEISQVSPRVILAPSDFSMEGQAGSMSSWKEFGQWIGKLNQGRDVLSDELKSEIQKLAAEVSSEREKIKIVYDYLQNNTRYVSIQLGIGGFQPFDALTVEKNGYGDCKALSNFTYSLLKSIGIKSNYTLITAGETQDDILTDFPSQQFNHVILAVPMEQDTVWLECTSQEAPFNFLGGFTSDRHALMITEEGGVLVKTPQYSEEDNSKIRMATVIFEASGDAKAEVKTEYRGRQFDDNYFLVKESKQDQKNFLLNTINLPILDLESFDYEEVEGEIPVLKQQLNLNLRKFGSRSGNRIFFSPNLMNRGFAIKVLDQEDRKYPIVNRYAFLDLDSVHYELPAGYAPEFIPESVEERTAFGSYEFTYTYSKETNEILMTRRLVINKGSYPASQAEDYFEFRKTIVDSDKVKIILLKSSD